MSSCGQTPSRARISGPRVAGSSPRTVSSPEVGGDTAAIIRIVEDLPAPLGPRNPKDSPARTSRSMPADRLHVAVRLAQLARPDQRAARRTSSPSEWLVTRVVPGAPASGVEDMRPTLRPTTDRRHPRYRLDSDRGRQRG